MTQLTTCLKGFAYIEERFTNKDRVEPLNTSFDKLYSCFELHLICTVSISNIYLGVYSVCHLYVYAVLVKSSKWPTNKCDAFMPYVYSFEFDLLMP